MVRQSLRIMLAKGFVFSMGLAAAVLASSAHAGTINLNDVYNGSAPFVGTNVTFTDVIEENGAPADPAINFYQSPIVLTDTLNANPVNFRAEAVGGPQTVNTASRLEMLVTSNNPNIFIDQIVVNEAGDYDILGNGWVEAKLSYTWEVLEAGGVPLGSPVSGNGSILFGANSPPASSGIWANMIVADIGSSVGNATKVAFSFTNTLKAHADDVISLGFVAKKQLDGVQVITTVPEPATASLLLLGLIPLARRVRRRD
ncbi:MAG: hypothetical protein R3E01_28555 [Pirellulaceae bacterium]|nr:hypothetical protein [Planctomycetales bacterium]